jgi:uncharacterized protein YebE (UPF0316 family)
MILLDTFYDSGLFTYLILPLLIFLSRILDVSIGTVRIVMLSKGQKVLAPILGFFEVFIWLLAISRIFENMDNWVCFISYAAGFAMGNYVGLKIEERLAVGIVRIQIVTRKEASTLIAVLKESGYGITHLKAQGGSENVSIIYTVLKRTDVPMVENIIREFNPNAFYSVEDVKYVNKGIFPIRKTRRWRKGK